MWVVVCWSGREERTMPGNRKGLDEHEELVPHFATRAEIAELREKVMSLQTIVRALAEKQGADPDLLEHWALCMGQFNSEPGRALSTAQRAAMSVERAEAKGAGALRLRPTPNAAE
jgi:hypothetical protein